MNFTNCCTSTSNTYTINTGGIATTNTLFIPQNLTYSNTINSVPEISFTLNKEDFDKIIKQINEIEERKKEYCIVKVEELKKNTVYRFTFSDNTIIKTIRSDSDPFSLEFAFYLAIAKKVYGKEYTHDGVYEKAKEMKNLKKYNKMVTKCMKEFLKTEKEREKEKEKERELKAIKERKRAKRIQRKNKLKQNRINEMTQAILNAREIIDNKYNK